MRSPQQGYGFGKFNAAFSVYSHAWRKAIVAWWSNARGIYSDGHHAVDLVHRCQ